MIDSIIATYIRGNKRLVVPDFGAFLRKEDGETVFVEFLKKDDHVLNSLIRERYGVDEGRARAIIDEYVSGIRHAVQTTGRAVVDGVGTLRPDGNGVLILMYDPRTQKTETQHIAGGEQHHAEHSHAHVSRHNERAPEPPPMQVISRSGSDAESAAAAPSVGDDIIMMERIVNERERPVAPSAQPSHSYSPQHSQPQHSPQREEARPFTLNDLYTIKDEPRTEPQPQPQRHQQQPHHAHHTDPARPDSRHRQHPARPDERQHLQQPAARPHTPPQSARHNPHRPGGHPRQQVRRTSAHRGGGRSKTDWVMIIAILAAVVALGSMLYGMLVSGDSGKIKPTKPQVEAAAAFDGDPDSTVEVFD
ncbi:MAG: hypothetical protein FWE10_07600 [Rikenellaceae bacterium]|nr:hypothetical protein [Rikenellaceae bacterium]MCL2692807.1 hypothetical protein [Rikenellaceae bacterium]